MNSIFPSRLSFAICLLLAAILLPAGVRAQFLGSSPAAPVVEKSDVIEPANILRRANSDELFIQSVIRNSQGFDEGQELARELDAISRSVEFAAKRQSALDMQSLTVRRLEGIERQWKFYEAQWEAWRLNVRGAASPLAKQTADLSKLRLEWKATVADATASPALLDRAKEIVSEVSDAEAVLSAPLADMIALGRRGNDTDADIRGWLRLVEQQLDARDVELLALDSPPLWRLTSVGQTGRAGRAGLIDSIALERGFARDFDAANAVKYTLLAALAAMLLPLMIWLSRRVTVAEATAEATISTSRILRRPALAWVVILILIFMAVGFNGPLIRMQIILFLGWIPVLLMLPAGLMARLGRAPYYGAFFYFVTVSASLVFSQFFGYRFAQLAISFAMIFAFSQLFKRPGNKQDVRLDRVVDIWCLIAMAALSFSVFANVIGNMTLATAMVEGVLDSSYAALAIYAVAVVVLKISNSAAIGLASTRFDYLGTRLQALVPAATPTVTWILMAFWGYSLLSAFRLYRPFSDWVGTLAEYRFSMGEFSISLGSIVIFPIAVWGAAILAKAVRKALADNILPSFSFSHGAGTSIASLVYYGMMLAGFLIALSLAGFDLGKLTIILGALGVGIGFGLQGSVGNFINSIVMLIERPIRQGDIVNFEGTVGTVQNIGMRATTLRTPHGAEVVIPNSALLEGKITNWSPFGSPRLIEVDIAVELKNDQATVQRLILETATGIKGIAANPPPLLLFHGYSPGTMNFAIRMWTLRGTDWELARSQYVTALDVAFREAGMSLAISRAEFRMNLDGANVATGNAP